MQSCILSGGAAVGVSMSALHQPWEAMALGFTAAIISTLGFRYLKVFTINTDFMFLKNLHFKTLVNTFCFRPTCWWRLSATTPVLFWAHTDSLVCWGGSHNLSCRLKIVMITQCKNAPSMSNALTKKKRRDNMEDFFLFFLSGPSVSLCFTSPLSLSPSL